MKDRLMWTLFPSSYDLLTAVCYAVFDVLKVSGIEEISNGREGRTRGIYFSQVGNIAIYFYVIK